MQVPPRLGIVGFCASLWDFEPLSPVVAACTFSFGVVPFPGRVHPCYQHHEMNGYISVMNVFCLCTSLAARFFASVFQFGPTEFAVLSIIVSERYGAP